PEETVAANLQPSPTATASVSLRARPDAPRWVPPGKQPSGRGAPMSTAAAPTLEPTKPGRAPPNPLDIELQ
ncbi:MAG: hypothetical protein M3O46_09830, partial [Myxococcota bacterium]|nr:hypothetical protein [Myxococcota bacterium]